MVTRKNQLLLNFLRVKVIVDGKQIYSLNKEQPVDILLDGGHSHIVATDGYHITPPLELVYPHTYFGQLKVVCAIDDNRLIAGGVLLVLFYLGGLTSGLLLLKLMSILPILYILYFYYLNRKDFIQIRPA